MPLSVTGPRDTCAPASGTKHALGSRATTRITPNAGLGAGSAGGGLRQPPRSRPPTSRSPAPTCCRPGRWSAPRSCADPRASPASACGLEQSTTGAASRLHWNVAPSGSLEWNAISASAGLSSPDGAASKITCGATVSTVQRRSTAAPGVGAVGVVADREHVLTLREPAELDRRRAGRERPTVQRALEAPGRRVRAHERELEPRAGAADDPRRPRADHRRAGLPVDPLAVRAHAVAHVGDRVVDFPARRRPAHGRR